MSAQETKKYDAMRGSHLVFGLIICFTTFIESIHSCSEVTSYISSHEYIVLSPSGLPSQPAPIVGLISKSQPGGALDTRLPPPSLFSRFAQGQASGRQEPVHPKLVFRLPR